MALWPRGHNWSKTVSSPVTRTKRRRECGKSEKGSTCSISESIERTGDVLCEIESEEAGEVCVGVGERVV